MKMSLFVKLLRLIVGIQAVALLAFSYFALEEYLHNSYLQAWISGQGFDVPWQAAIIIVPVGAGLSVMFALIPRSKVPVIVPSTLSVDPPKPPVKSEISIPKDSPLNAFIADRNAQYRVVEPPAAEPGILSHLRDRVTRHNGRSDDGGIKS